MQSVIFFLINHDSFLVIYSCDLAFKKKKIDFLSSLLQWHEYFVVVVDLRRIYTEKVALMCFLSLIAF